MYKFRRLRTAGVLALSVALGGCMVACSSEGGSDGGSAVEGVDTTVTDTSEGVAATVNGVEIGEKVVTDYIADFRASAGLEDDASWAEWMSTNGYDPESVRQDVIDYYANDILLRQAAEEYGITVEEAEVDEELASVREQFESDEAWQEALEASNFTEDEYKKTVLEPNLMQEKLSEAVSAETGTGEVTDEDIVAMAQEYETMFDGARKSSHILFDLEDEETAQSVLDQIKNGDITFEDAVAEYSTDSGSAADGGNVGWDRLTTFVDQYQTALDGLEKDEMSDLVESDYGYHIILCTDVYNVPEGGIQSVDDMPAEFQEEIAAQLEYQASDSFTTWFDEYVAKADIVVNPMPEGLPYDIDMAEYVTTDTEDVVVEDDGLAEAEADTTDEGAAEAEVEVTETESTDEAAAEAGTADEEVVAEEETATE